MKHKLIVCTGNLSNIEGVPEKIKILPRGLVCSQKGEFIVDEESWQLILKHFKERKIDLVIDYEHQTLNNEQAPAGGWVKELYLDNDAISAKVEWTDRAKEYLKNKEYKYLSPVVIVRHKDQKAVSLHSIALTNTPAIDGMFAIVNSIDINNSLTGGKEMDLEKLIELLGLDPKATEEEVLKRIEELKAGKGNADNSKSNPSEPEANLVANSTILSLLELNESATTEDVTASIMALKAGDTKVLTEVFALKKKLEERDADDLVAQALKEGKISAAQSEWAKEYALKNSAGFKKFLEKAPAVVPVGKLDVQEAPAADVSVDPMVLKNMGLTKEDLEKYGKMGDKSE